MPSLGLPKAMAVGGAAGIARRELFIWLTVCLLANQALNGLHAPSLAALAGKIASQNLIFWFACYVIVSRLLGSHSTLLASHLDVSVSLVGAVAIVFAAFIGRRHEMGVLMTFAATYLLYFHRGDRSLYAAGAVLLALSAHLVWGPVFFRYFAPELLFADAALVNFLLAALDSGLVQVGTTIYAPDDHSIQLVGACSSFNNVSVALVASVAMIMWVRPYWVRADMRWIIGICAAMIALNTIRLSLLAWSDASYRYWHGDTSGPALFALIQTAVVAVMGYQAAVSGVRSK